MKEHLIRFLDDCLKMAKAPTATSYMVNIYENQAFGALTFYCEVKPRERETLINLWNDYYRTEFFSVWMGKTK